MDRKYEITSASTMIQMMISFNRVEDGISEPMTVPVSVDYLNDRVYFDEKVEGIDYRELEDEILAHLRPDLLEQPEIPPEILRRIEEVRAGNYGGNDIPQYEGFMR